MFFCWFLEESWELFFRVLVAEVSHMGATWGQFSRHVAAKVENWKQWFRVHQTLLFRYLRGWFRTWWAVFLRYLLKWVWRRYFTIFWEIECPAGSSKDVFWWAFLHIFWFVGALEMNILHFFGIWAWLRWWSEARVRTKGKKVQKQSKKKSKKESLFVRIICFL